MSGRSIDDVIAKSSRLAGSACGQPKYVFIVFSISVRDYVDD